MRIYLAATLPLLRDWLHAGAAESGVATGVTPALREAYRDGDLEELEWVAQQAAARASLALLGADPAAASQRAVLAVDVPDEQVSFPPVDARDPALLRLQGAVDRRAWASVLIDDGLSPADTDVIARAAGLLRGDVDLDDPAVRDALDDAEAVELGWWGVQELPVLLGD